MKKIILALTIAALATSAYAFCTNYTVIGPDGKTVEALLPTLYLRESAPSLLQAASQVSAPDILLQLAGKLDQARRRLG